jgi:hypothetical protein
MSVLGVKDQFQLSGMNTLTLSNISCCVQVRELVIDILV